MSRSQSQGKARVAQTLVKEQNILESFSSRQTEKQVSAYQVQGKAKEEEE